MRSNDVRPRLVGQRSTNHCATDAVLTGHFRLPAIAPPLAMLAVGANVPDRFVGQLGIVLPFTLRLAMQRPVSTVLCPGAPAQVIGPIVKRIAVEVSALHALRSRPEERFEDEMVDVDALATGALTQGSAQVPRTAAWHAYLAAPWPIPASWAHGMATPQAAIRTDSVRWPARNQHVDDDHFETSLLRIVQGPS